MPAHAGVSAYIGFIPQTVDASATSVSQHSQKPCGISESLHFRNSTFRDSNFLHWLSKGNTASGNWWRDTIDELVIGEEHAQQVAHLHVYIAFAQDCAGNWDSQFGVGGIG